VKALAPLTRRLATLAERLDALSIRERGLVFAAGVTLIAMAWQTLWMGPLNARAHAAEERLAEAGRQQSAIDQIGLAAAANPQGAATVRNRALRDSLAALDTELQSATQGYVSPQRMSDLLGEILAAQKGLTLVSLANLPAESLSQVAAVPGAVAASAASTASEVSGAAGAAGAAGAPGVSAAAGAAGGTPAANDRGPFLHPVEIVVDGDYVSLVAYLRALESLPYKIHWQRLELTTGNSSVSRVRIVIGALSLSREWIAV